MKFHRILCSSLSFMMITMGICSCDTDILYESETSDDISFEVITEETSGSMSSITTTYDSIVISNVDSNEPMLEVIRGETIEEIIEETSSSSLEENLFIDDISSETTLAEVVPSETIAEITTCTESAPPEEIIEETIEETTSAVYVPDTNYYMELVVSLAEDRGMSVVNEFNENSYQNPIELDETLSDEVFVQCVTGVMDDLIARGNGYRQTFTVCILDERESGNQTHGPGFYMYIG